MCTTELADGIIHLSTGLDQKSIATSHLLGFIGGSCKIPGQEAIYHIQHWNSHMKLPVWKRRNLNKKPHLRLIVVV